MSDQHIGRRRTFKVIDADGNEETTTVKTVGLQRKPARQVSAVDPPAPVPEPSAAVTETGDSADAKTSSEG